jgi:aldehyde:ferredoxin oxidoreductase
MFRGGYLGKLLRVNLSSKTTRVEPIGEERLRLLLGGRGLAAKYYYDEIGPQTQAFDEANKLFFFTGPLTGLALPSTTKFQLATRSPETRRYLCSNCGGNFGPRLKMAGFDALIIEGQAAEWTYLLIRDGEVSFADARPWQGWTTDRTLEGLYQAIGDSRAGAMAIGPAGEKRVRIACIQVDSRAFGRGGPGAVMGAKKLKGIAVSGSSRIPVSDSGKVSEIQRAATADLKTSRANHTRYGTPQYIEAINELGCMPTRNFQSAWFEGTAQVDAHAMRERYLEKNYACYRCPVACGKICVVKAGPYAGARARPEFETIGLLGPNCGISDFGAIIQANQRCDQLGIDTMSAGNAVALTMELYERGLIGPKETAGIEARFGQPEALIGLIERIGERKAIGDLLAEGMLGVKQAHPEWSPYILEVKGLPFAAYDPRGFHGNGLTYGTSSRGACHNVGGWTIRAELQSGKYDRFALEGKGRLVKGIQDNRAYVDSLGLCTVVRGAVGFSEEPKGEVMKAATGYDFMPELMRIGERIYNLERLILTREGIRRRDDLLPPRISREAIPSGPTRGRILTEEMYGRMLDEYYRERGWDADGVPTTATVAGLGLAGLAAAAGEEESVP